MGNKQLNSEIIEVKARKLVILGMISFYYLFCQGIAVIRNFRP